MSNILGCSCWVVRDVRAVGVVRVVGVVVGCGYNFLSLVIKRNN